MRSALILLSLILFTINDAARSERPDQVEYPTYYANVNGLTIAYQEFGDPEHETIMLVMGLGGQLIHWDDDLVWQLTDAGFHVIRFDNRDAGWSSKLYHESTPGILTGLRYKLGMSLGSPYKLDDMADDALGLLAHLNVKTAHVVGMSMGGMIAQIMAAKDPDKIQSLTSIMSSSSAEHLPAGTVDLNLSDRSDQTREQAILASATIGQQIDGTVAELNESQWIALTARSYDRSHYPEGFGRQFWAILDSGDRVELLKSIKQPALVIHGKADNLLPYQHGEHTAELISDSRLLLIEGMGHYIDRLNKPLIVKEIIKIASK
ncbi:alpha/beta hydrolase [Arenicella sp. 4NH20-0111]|uniref:alpha/beta fold hydrolase n=1 Tax=Arenicella sp. 4NH20-0111 TaxID=3127648 RepID=UPI003104C365